MSVPRPGGYSGGNVLVPMLIFFGFIALMFLLRKELW